MTPSTVPLPRRRHWVFKLLASLLLTLVLLEACLRLFGLDLPMAKNWRWHPQLGWSQTPATSHELTLDGERVHVAFNALGFRDVEHALAKPAGTRRIAILGDSYCEAIQVDFEDTFYRRLEHLLDARGGDVEILNFGVGDFGQGQELIALKEFALDYAPDLVICQVLPLNDICNNCIELYGLGRSHNDFYRPYFVEQDGVLVQTWAQPWRQTARRWSHVFRLGERIVQRALWELEPGSDADRWRARAVAAGFAGLSPPLYAFVPEADQPPSVRSAWRTTDLLLAEMAATCRARGIAFAVVVMAWDVCLADAWPAFAAAQPPPAMDVDYPERRLAALCQRLGVPMLATKTLFESDLARFRPVRDGHLGPGGHAMVAEALLRLVDERGLLR